MEKPSASIDSFAGPVLTEDGLLQLGQLADAVPQLVWIALRTGEVIYYNNRVQEFAGAYRGGDGRWNWQGMLHPDDQAATEQAWRTAVASGTVYEMEHRVQMRDGSYRWLLSRAFPQTNSRGEIEKWFGTATDIHEQKLVEEKVKEAEARWRTALEATEIGTWEYDIAAKTFFLSDVAKSIRGIAPEQYQPFRLHRESIHPDDVEAVAGAMTNAVAQGSKGMFVTEYRVRKERQEGWTWIRSIGRVVEEGEEPVRVIGIMQDITAQKEAEEKLFYLATLTQNIADAVIGTDPEFRIVNWNKGAENLYGWTAGEVIGKRAADVVQTSFFNPGGRAAWEREFEQKGSWQGEVQQLRKDGSSVFILASVSRVYNEKGEYIGGVAVNKDITTERTAVQQLRESEAQFRLLTNTIPQIVWVSNAGGELVYLNERWTTATGQTTEEGMRTRLDMMHPDDIAAVMPLWDEARAKGTAFHCEYRLLHRATNTYRWFFCKVQPLYDKDGAVQRWIGASSDIQHFKNASEQLENQVQERTMELQRLNQTLQRQAAELQRSNEDLQQFAHVASHDLKEPLRKIKTYGSRLVDEFGDVLPERARLYLEKMESAASRMSAMIDGVLGYSMLSITEQISERVDLNEVVQTIQTDLEVLFSSKQARLECGPLPVLEGASVLLYQLFYNLIGNALKFTRAGVPPVIRISARLFREAPGEGLLPVDHAEINVCDNGIGFEPEYAETIFKTFIRLNGKDQYEGTGLGLALCKKIAERHQGRIYAKAKPGAGACFTAVLPVAREGS